MAIVVPQASPNTVDKFYEDYRQLRTETVGAVAEYIPEPLSEHPALAARIALRAAQLAALEGEKLTGRASIAEFLLPEQYQEPIDIGQVVELSPSTRALAIEIMQAWIINSKLNDPVADEIAIGHPSLEHLRCSFLRSWVGVDLVPEDIGLDSITDATREEVFTNMRDGGVLDTEIAQQQVIDDFMGRVGAW